MGKTRLNWYKAPLIEHYVMQCMLKRAINVKVIGLRQMSDT